MVVIQVQHANPWEVRNALTTMRTVTDARFLCDVVGGDSLLVTTDEPKTLKKVRDLLAKLDEPRRPGPPAKPDVCKPVPLEHAEAEFVARALLRLTPERRGRVRVVSDEDANAVWIAGAQRAVEWLVDVAMRMDEHAAAAGLSEEPEVAEVRFYRLKHADAGNLAGILGRLLREMDIEVTLVPDVASGTLLAYATPAALSQVHDVVEQLDVPAQTEHERRPMRPHRRGDVRKQ
jgi:type II secretory pathway component GspD/PulD (secretin)